MARTLTIILISALLGCASRERSQISKANGLDSRAYVPDAHVYVGREVRAPGAYPWTNGMRLTDVVMRAGGLTDFATRSRIRVFHADGTREVHDYDRILKKKTADPALRSGDYVHITSPIF